MEFLLNRLSDLTNVSLVELSALLLVSTITGFTLFFREMMEWRRARFESRINISLNTIHKGVLRIRTVHEDEVGSVVLSPYAQRILKNAAKKTTIEDPFLHFANEREAWMVYHEIVLTISCLYSAEILSAAMHNISEEEQFFIALTWERDSNTRIKKLRVLMAQENVLRAAGAGHASIRPEVPEHAARINALAEMHKKFFNGWPVYQIVSLPKV